MKPQVKQWELGVNIEKGYIQIIKRSYKDSDGTKTDMGTTRYFKSAEKMRRFLQLFKFIGTSDGKRLYKAKKEGWYIIK